MFIQAVYARAEIDVDRGQIPFFIDRFPPGVDAGVAACEGVV